LSVLSDDTFVDLSGEMHTRSGLVDEDALDDKRDSFGDEEEDDDHSSPHSADGEHNLMERLAKVNLGNIISSKTPTIRIGFPPVENNLSEVATAIGGDDGFKLSVIVIAPASTLLVTEDLRPPECTMLISRLFCQKVALVAIERARSIAHADLTRLLTLSKPKRALQTPSSIGGAETEQWRLYEKLGAEVNFCYL